MIARAIVIWLVCSSALAQESADATYLAQQRYDAGLAAYEAGQLDEALGQFRGSFAMVRSPNTRLMVARCLRNLERFAEALIEYELTAREAADRAQRESRFEATVAAAESEGAAVRARVGHVRVSIEDAPDDVRIEIAGREVPREALGLPIPVDPGPAIVRARSGERTVERAIAIVAGEEREVSLAFSAPIEVPVERAPAPVARGASAAGPIAWALGGLALAALPVAIGFTVAAQSRYDELVMTCGGPCNPPEDDLIAEGRTFEIGAYTGWAIAGVMVVGAIVSFAIDGASQ